MRTVGIVGAGGISQKMHLPVLSAFDSVRVSWLTDADPVQAKRAGSAFHVPHVALPPNPRDLPEADVILLAIPYGARPPYLEALRERPAAIYLEKPFARTVEEHQKLCGWFGDTRLGGGFQRRSWAPVQLLRTLADQELFGALQEIQFSYGRVGATSGGAHSDIRLSGGGMLFESAIHGIDALLFASRAVEARIVDADMILDHGFDLHTTASLAITTARGQSVPCRIEVSCLEETSNLLSFRFEHAEVFFNLFGDGTVGARSILGGDTFRIESKPYPLTSYQTAYEHWVRFFEGLDQGRPNWTSAADSLLTTSVIEGLYAAAR